MFAVPLLLFNMPVVNPRPDGSRNQDEAYNELFLGRVVAVTGPFLSVFMNSSPRDRQDLVVVLQSN